MAKSKNKESKGLDLIENSEEIINKTEAFLNDKKNQNIVFISIGISSLIFLAFMGFSHQKKIIILKHKKRCFRLSTTLNRIVLAWHLMEMVTIMDF